MKDIILALYHCGSDKVGHRNKLSLLSAFKDLQWVEISLDPHKTEISTMIIKCKIKV